jgi:transcriptional regulator with XRE-family HTH domain
VSSVGENVIRLREQRGWDQGELAERLGIKQPSMWKIEKGTPKWWKVELGTILKLAVALEVPIEDIVAGLSEPYEALRRDLLRQSPSIASAPQKGRADVPASAHARILELETKLKNRDTQLRAIQEVASRLFALAAGQEIRAAPARTPRSRKGRRKVG